MAVRPLVVLLLSLTLGCRLPDRWHLTGGRYDGDLEDDRLSLREDGYYLELGVSGDLLPSVHSEKPKPLQHQVDHYPVEQESGDDDAQAPEPTAHAWYADEAFLEWVKNIVFYLGGLVTLLAGQKAHARYRDWRKSEQGAEPPAQS